MSKRQKSVTVYVCDVCGDESNWLANKCVSCGKEICQGCTASYSVEVTRRSQVQRHEKSSSQLHERMKVLGGDVNYWGTYCEPCGLTIEARLLVTGFVPRRAERTTAVMD